MRKRFFVFVLALLMLLGAGLVSVFADDGEAWIEQECPVAAAAGEDPALHNLHWNDIQRGDCTHVVITEIYCSECGKSHTAWGDPAPGHLWDEGVITKPATCTEPGEMTYTCQRLIINTNCGEKKTEVIPALGHSWDSGTVTKTATCAAAGVITYTCTRCGGTMTESIPALDHVPGEWVVDLPATCTEQGIENHICSVCHEAYEDRQYGPLGHKWDEGQVIKEATCQAEGTILFTCQNDPRHTYTSLIPLKAHAPETWAGYPATCTEPGLMDGVHCASCGEVFEDRQGIPALGHEPVTVAGKAATCTEAGLTDGSRCNRCGIVITAQTEIPATGHNYQVTASKEPTATEEGYRTYTCANCGDSYTETLPKSAHSHNYQVTAEKPATCTEQGSKTYSCSVCGDAYTETSSALGHEPVTVGGKTAACTEAGLTDGSRCNRCGIVITAQTEIPALGHDWGGWTVVTAAQPGIKGQEKRVCSRCSAEEYRDLDALPISPVPVTEVPTTEVPTTEVPITPVVEGPGYFALLAGAVVQWDDDDNAAGARPDSVSIQIYYDGVYETTATITKEGGWNYSLLAVKPGKTPDVTFEEVVPEGYVCTRSTTGHTTTFVNKYMPEGPHPALTLIKDKQTPEGDVEAGVWVHIYDTLINSGNVDLKIVYHRVSWPYELSEPLPAGKSISNSSFWIASDHLTPGTETAEYLGRFDVTYWFTGHDPVTGEQLCESNHISGSWNVKRPGPAGWEIPDETQDSDVKITQWENGASADPSGYQLGEKVYVKSQWENISSVPGIVVNQYFPFDGDSDALYLMPGIIEYSDVTIVLPDWHLYAVTETDVDNGYIYFPPLEGTWTDPGSGKEKKAVSNPLTIPVISKTGLLLHKSVANIPANSSWFEEGETIRWSLTVTNNSQEPIRNITVTDQGVTVGSFAELAPGETQPCTVPDYVVTGYDAIIGSVMNQASASGEDVREISHTWDSNPAHAPTNKDGSVKYPVPDPDGKKTPDPDPDKKPDPDGHTDPLGPVITGSIVSAFITKAETSFPANGSWYQEGETISYLITVTNDGEVPLTHISVTDSLGGFLPISISPSLAPGESVSFPFSWIVTASDVAAGWVINSAAATYEITGIPGTPILSAPVYSQTSENPGPIPGITPGGTPELPGGTFDPEKLPKDPGGGSSLVPVLDPDGKPLLDPDGKPVIAPPGTTPVVGPDGKIVTDPSGYPVLKLPDGTYVVIGPDGKVILTDEAGNPILDANGQPTYLDFGSGTAFCQMQLLGLGATDGIYNLHACSDHAQAARDAEAAAAAGTPEGWRAAAEIWRGEVDEMYQILFDAADSGAKAAVLNDQVTYYSYLGTYKAMRAGGDETATERMIAESLRLRAIELCNIIHSVPEKLADSLAGNYQTLGTSAVYDRSAREIGALQGADSLMNERYDTAYGRTLAGIRTRLLQTGGSQARTGAFLQAQRDWQLTLDAIVNANYKAAGPDGRKAIAACRILLDKVYEARKGFLDLLYADAPEVAAEIVSNLYRNAILEAR